MLYPAMFVSRVALGGGLVFENPSGSDYNYDCSAGKRDRLFKVALRMVKFSQA
jgi:hypothetical protein